MTATEARRGLILLPIKCGCSARAYNRGSIPTPIPDLPGIGARAGDGGPTPDFQVAGDRGPIPIPDLPESGIKLSTTEYYKGVDCSGSGPVPTIVQPINLNFKA